LREGDGKIIADGEDGEDGEVVAHLISPSSPSAINYL